MDVENSNITDNIFWDLSFCPNMNQQKKNKKKHKKKGEIRPRKYSMNEREKASRMIYIFFSSYM